MGGDHAPVPQVTGALRAWRSGSDVLLVGDEAFVRPLLPRRAPPLLHAGQTVHMEERASAPLRAKPRASIRVAMDALAEGRADAVVSCGHSGAALAAALHVLGGLEGVRRPALLTGVPTTGGGEALLLDTGANVDCTAERLVEFARMGAAYARAVKELDRPRVGLLSNGEERTRGNAVLRAACPLLDALDGPTLAFVGPVEPRQAFGGEVDVVVTDGFVGNVLLKTVEATAGVVAAILRQEMARHPLTRLGALLTRAALSRFRRRTGPSNYGGAILLGVDGVVVVAHGRADAQAVEAAVHVAERCVREEVVARVRAAMAPGGRATCQGDGEG